MANTSKKSLDINGLEYVASKVMTLVNSGGTADYLVEEGTSGIWTYRKWASGIAECWGTLAYSGTWQTAFGGSAYTLLFDAVSYPFMFIDVPNVQYAPDTMASGSIACWVGINQALTDLEKKSSCKPSLYRLTTGADNTEYRIFTYAKGFWKEFTPDIMKTPSLDLYYPVGSIYQTSNANFDPNVTFGGTWELITNKFLIGAGDEYENGEEGGSTEHMHQYGMIYGTYYYAATFEGGAGGLLDMQSGSSSETLGEDTSLGQSTYQINNSWAGAAKSLTAGRRKSVGNTTKTDNLPPYKAVYMWERIA